MDTSTSSTQNLRRSPVHNLRTHPPTEKDSRTFAFVFFQNQRRKTMMREMGSLMVEKKMKKRLRSAPRYLFSLPCQLNGAWLGLVSCGPQLAKHCSSKLLAIVAPPRLPSSSIYWSVSHGLMVDAWKEVGKDDGAEEEKIALGAVVPPSLPLSISLLALPVITPTHKVRMSST